MTIENEQCPIKPSNIPELAIENEEWPSRSLKILTYMVNSKTELFDFASIKHDEFGRGAIFLSDIDDVTEPPRWISLQDAKALGFDDLVPFIEAYDPDNSFAISLICDGKRTHFRVDRKDDSSEAE